MKRFFNLQHDLSKHFMNIFYRALNGVYDLNSSRVHDRNDYCLGIVHQQRKKKTKVDKMNYENTSVANKYTAV